MKLSIHQPQYIPWLSYFLKISQSDKFILLDTVSFQKNGLQNRNQIKDSNGKFWLTVPVIHNAGQKILDVKINNRVNWQKKHHHSLLHCYKNSTHFIDYADEIEEIYSKTWENLKDINLEFIIKIMKWMDIETNIVLSSNITTEGTASNLILNLCKDSNADEYISGLGGDNYLDENTFIESGVKLIKQPPIIPNEYTQQFKKTGFINDLSVLDILFNCGNNWRSYLPSRD
tara:strand:+ start:9554 stop:10243 length:690 start_codon:yes stop_codon:yes gene_type:complete